MFVWHFHFHISVKNTTPKNEANVINFMCNIHFSYHDTKRHESLRQIK